MTEPTTPVRRASLWVKRLVSYFISRLRRIVGILLQLTVHDQLGEMDMQTQRLAAASVESIAYLGSELRALDERLSKIESDIAALRELLTGSQAAPAEPEQRSGEVASAQRSE
jgi:hypothetical protein